jgi:hypothetical protein
MSRMITQSLKTVHGVELRTPPLPDPPKRVTPGQQPNRLTVACVWYGTRYGIEYVEKLRNSVARNLSIPFDFVCITPHQKVPEGVIRMSPPIPHDPKFDGWWQKVGLFSPDLFGPSQRILYLDLDVVIINSLDTIASSDDSFCMIENFGPNKGHAAHNSSCMLWTPTENTARIFTQFSPDVMKELHGDQCWIWRVMLDEIRNFERYQCVSYKYERHPQWRHANDKTSVVVFHGKPKPHEVSDFYIRDNWA